MEHLGDITKMIGSEIEPVDVIIGGSPCQDLSIAGKRAGLAGERSVLFMEQIRIVKEMRDAEKQCGRTNQFIRPRFMLWENVPGAISSNKGEDFRIVLQETARIAEPDASIPRPPKGKWRTSGCILGDRWSIAWRILDAQFWGVPQRRRRIALVADFGGHAAPEILFVRQSVCGDIKESGAEGETIAAGIEKSVGSAVALRMRAGCEGGGKGALVQVEKSGTLGRNNNQTIFGLNDQGGSVMGTSVDISGTLRAQEHGHQPIICAGFKHKAGAGAGSIGFQKETVPTLSEEQTSAVYIHQNQTGEVRTGQVAGTLNTNSNASGRNAPIVYDARGNGDGKTACTLTGDHQSRITDYTAIVLPFDTTQITSPQNGCLPHYGDPCHPLAAGAHPPAIVMGVDCRNLYENEELSATLQAKENGGQSLNYINPIRVGGQVRRLTPLECERLQGYPDGWTDIGPWTDSAGKLHKESSDTARYKALGNSIALPPWKWVLKRLCACYERDATMGSLFDGIGGFPLLWERLNGPGTCLWASEVEEFCVAVTKKRVEG